MINDEHRLENYEPEPGEPRLQILQAWAYAKTQEPKPEPRLWYTEPEPEPELMFKIINEFFVICLIFKMNIKEFKSFNNWNFYMN